MIISVWLCPQFLLEGLKQYAAGSVWTDSRFLSWFFSEINERQRAILEEFAEEEIKNGIDNSNEASWSVDSLCTLHA